ncbi:MAG: hypothetical protein Q9200_005870 [Gallowayella weberi]
MSLDSGSIPHVLAPRFLSNTIKRPSIIIVSLRIAPSKQTDLQYIQRAYLPSQSYTMAEPSIYDEIELEDLTYHPSTTLYTYPCPCGDQFEITLQDLRDGEDIAVCPSCSLMIRVIFEPEDLPAEEPPKEESTAIAVEVGA